MNRVFLVTWSSGDDHGVMGIFSSRDKAENAIDMDKEQYPVDEYGYCDYNVESYYVDEVEP